MAFHLGKLGWRHPRPNDFSSPDQRPLRDTFTDIQHFMTWPHFRCDIDLQATDTGAFTKVTITSTEDPYHLIRDATDEILVPQDFDKWLFIGHAGGLFSPRVVARHLLGWFLNGTSLSDLIGETDTAAVIGTGTRVQSPLIYPVRKGDVLSIGSTTNVATFIDGQALGYFLPMA